MAKKKSKSAPRKTAKSRKVVRSSAAVASKKATKTDKTAVIVVGIALLVLLAYYFMQ